MKFKQLVIVISVLVITIIFLLGYFEWGAQNDIKNFEYQEIDMNRVNDGSYEASVVAELVSASVLVTVKNHRIVSLELIEHNHSLGYSAEAIVNDMILKNSYEVDAISGATLSSEVIKSATSLALRKGY